MSVRSLFASVCAIVALTTLNGLQARGQNFLASGQVTVASRVTQPIDESARIALKGTVHPLANAANDRGEAPESLPLGRVHMVLRRSDSQEKALHQLIQDMHTPGNPNYHKWLTPDQFGSQFGPSDQDIATIESWLQSKGFAVKQVNPGRQTLEFSGSAGQFRDAFHATIHRYEVNGKTHYANAANPEIPAALAPVVGGFVSINNFSVKGDDVTLGKATYQPSTHQAKAEWTNASPDSLLIAPADLAVQYDFTPLYNAGYTGTGQSVAVVNESNVDVAVVNQFRSMFGLPVNPPQVVIDGNDPGIGGINDPNPNGNTTEAYLDVEWAGAAAPNATIYLVIAGDTPSESGLYLAAEHAVYSNIAPVMSFSFGLCEQYLGSSNAFFNSLWEQAAAQGITVVVPAGDTGSSGCDSDEFAVSGLGVNGMASTPYNVAVGGTDFYYGQTPTVANLTPYWDQNTTLPTQASLYGYIAEQPWNGSQYGLNINTFTNGSSTVMGGGGGKSSCASGSGVGTSGGWATCSGGYPKPAWQSGTGVPADSVRDIPDVSLFASSGQNDSYYPACANDGDCQPVGAGLPVQVTAVGGTSVAASVFAGIMSMVDEKWGRQGQANNTLYPLKTQYPTAFHDITHGTNSQPCNIAATTGGVTSYPPVDCIAVTSPFTVTDPGYGTSVEGELGTGTTPAYNAAAGYNLATGLGSVDAYWLVSEWGVVKFAATTTTLTPSSTAFAHGTPITISGTVTGTTPTGQVALMTDNPTPLQAGLTSFTLASGAYSSSSVIDLPGGTYNIWGQYSGDTKNAPSTSTKTAVTVTPEASILALNLTEVGGSDPLTAIPYGASMLASVQVTGGSCSISCVSPTLPTGTVALLNGATTLKTIPVNLNGTAQDESPYAVQTAAYLLSAKYSGDSSYNASTSSTCNGLPGTCSFTVVKDTPTVSLTVNGSATGQGVSGTATVLTIQVVNSNSYSSAAASPTGTVTLAGAPSGVPTTATLAYAVAPLSNAVEGVATITFPATTAAGTYPVTISYPGDTNYAAVPTTPISVTIAPGTLLTTSTTAVLSTPTVTTTSPIAAISVLVTVADTSGSGTVAPTGTVSIFSNGAPTDGGGGVPLNPSASTSPYSATAALTFNSQLLGQGANLITFVYSGDAKYRASTTTLNLTNPLSDFTMSPQSASVPILAGANATDPIYVTSKSGFAGAVTLTCTAPTGTTCSITTPATLTSGGNATATLTLGAPSTTASGKYSVVVTGTDSTGNYIHTLGIQAAVSGLLAITSPATLPAGTYGTAYAQTLAASGGSGAGYVWSLTPTDTTNLAAIGLSLNLTTGVLSGAAATLKVGSVTFAATVTDSFKNTVTKSITVTINKAAPSIGWVTPAAITYGTALSTTQLNATATVPGTFVYTPALGAVPGAGLQTLSVTFTPTDTTDYSTPSAATVTLTVNKATPTVTWAAPTPITYPTALSATQLDASSGGVAGTFVYTPPAGTVLAVGSQTLSVTFTPTDTTDYNTPPSPSATVTLTVNNKTTPTITWATPAAISYGTALSATQLDASSGAVAGTLVYTPPLGTVLAAGSQTLSVQFTPTDTTTYNTASATVQLTVNKVTPTIAWATPAAITYGTQLSATQLNASSGGVAGTFVYTPTIGAMLGAGSQTLSVQFTPTNTADYNTPSPATVTLTVNKASPTVTVTPSASGITPAQALTVTVTVSGTATGTVTLTGGGYTSAVTPLSGGSVQINIPGGSLAAGSDTLTANYSGDSNDSPNIGTAVVTVTAPGFTITGSAGSVAPGATTGNSSSISVASVGGFSGSVTLTATITGPAGAQDPPTWSFGSTSPVSVASSAPGTATLTISTTAASSAAMTAPKRPGVPWYTAGGAILSCILLFGIPARRRRFLNVLGMLVLLLSLAGGMIACGGSSNSGTIKTNIPGTTPGTYTATVTGTSGATTATGTVTITVQ
ncbi:MAG: Ig-like domain repeat protein [Terracidiphilus sp.]